RLLMNTTIPRPLSVTSIAGAGSPASRTAIGVEGLSHWDGTREDLERVASLLIDSDSPSFDDHVSIRLGWASAPGHYRAIRSASVPVPSRLSAAIVDPWPAQLADNSVPILLVGGRRDRMLEPSWAQPL